uniref:Superoxide dismutase n=1 Tax=Amphimedon queenslandica TaxID=400682 RepID=A0A1X7SX77_AMPQE
MFHPADEYSFPQLPGYDYHELGPYIDQRTLTVHHKKHHQGYTVKMNQALKDWRKQEPQNDLARSSIINILQNLERVPDKWRTTLQNNAGGYVNHIYYWVTMCPKPGDIPKALLKKIEASFPAGMSEFKNSFTTASLSLFGSGYVWLVTDDEGSISIISTKNQVLYCHAFILIMLYMYHYKRFLRELYFTRCTKFLIWRF